MTHMAQGRLRNLYDDIFEREIFPLADQLYTFAWRLSNDSTLADDLVQETYLRAWKSIHSYETATNAKAWLFTICRNTFINEYRKRKNQPYKVDYEDIVVYHNEDEPNNFHYLDLSEEMHGQLMGDEMTHAINELPASARLIVLLDIEGFTYEEIAAIADIPIGTVRSRLHRSRNFLAEQLRSYAAAQGYNVADNKGKFDGPAKS